MKLKALQEHLRQEKISLAIFLHPDPAITYFTQKKFSYAVLGVTPRKAVLLVTKLDQKPHLPGITVKNLKPGWKKEFSRIRRIGINQEQCMVASRERLKKYFPKARFVDLAAKMWMLRERKTTAEIGKISRACHISDKALRALIQELPRRTLRTEQDVAFFLEKNFRQQGGEAAFPTIVALGKNTAVPHHVTDTTPLQRGFLQLDFGASYKNYCADMSRVIFLGKPTAKEIGFYGLLHQAQQAAVDAVEEGKKFMELDKLVRKKLGKYSRYFIHSLGHGIGVEVHEAPSYSEDATIQKNQAFTIEPGIYFPGKFGLRIEDTLVFEGKARILTKSTKELVAIPHY